MKSDSPADFADDRRQQDRRRPQSFGATNTKENSPQRRQERKESESQRTQ